jgi:hypothetical protein
VLWKLSDKVAIRPEITFTGGSAESSPGSFELESDNWSLGMSVSGLFYLKKYDRLQTYVTPRFSYQHVSTTSQTTAPVTTPETTTTGNSYGFTGSFGGEYALGDKFAVFGEFGFGLSHLTTKSSLSTGKATSSAWGTRSAVGVVFFP